MVTIERDDGGGFVDISDKISDWKIDHGVSDVMIAPTATVRTGRGSGVSSGDTLRITDAGTTMFTGGVERAPTSTTGTDKVEASSEAVRFFEDTVSLSVSNPSAVDVLSAAITESDVGLLVSLDWVGADVALGDDYEVTDRSCKRVFRDIVDRTGRVWWTGLDGTIHVDTRGGRGTFASVDTATDAAEVREFDDSDLDTVINVQTVNGTTAEKVTATAEDSGSITQYDRRAADPINVSYISSESEAQSYAEELLVPEPLARAEVNLGSDVGDIRVPIVNYSLDVTDAGGTGMDEELPIEAQTIRQGTATVQLGEGAGANIAKLNRKEKSDADVTEPGSVYGSDRIADGSIVEQKLEDFSVSVDKIQDGAVQEAKVFQDAITETKIQDGSISTPKLKAGSITAGKIDAAAVTATAIAADAVEAGKIDADAVGARELIANSITAGEIDTLDLETESITIGAGLNGFLEFDNVTGIPNFVSWAALVPNSDGECYVGTSNRRLFQIHSDEIFSEEYNTDAGLRITGQQITPGGAGVGNSGITGNYWGAVRSGAYFEESPEPLTEADIDLEELCGCSDPWYDPPEYIRRESAKKEAEVEPDDAEADGMGDPQGLELGTVSNYLLGACRSLAERNAELEGRLDDLEARLDALEQQ